MVLRHFTSHRDVIQDEAVDTPHANLTPDGSETGESGQVWLNVKFMLKHCAYDRMTRGLPRDPARYLPQASPIQKRTMQGVTRLVEDHQTAPTPPRTDRVTMSKAFLGLWLSHETEKTSTRGEEGRICTEISGGSQVLNGDAKIWPQAGASRTHTITGGAITRGSVLINGDMDHDTFMKIFGRSR
ncbi:hypothetical protein N7520_009664 [Penicillium odoratum]|uniref:uncharacterized protein n=1 Tax=Penicillium odoratum TaxID=1167516 RepID=UPI002548A49E|nr:uncharacterized protein N7520_009664 [Penicillium odoratum]KAJ5752747.1 hypothetical protein N7520_009664 [Penicillium odoratum]